MLKELRKDLEMIFKKETIRTLLLLCSLKEILDKTLSIFPKADFLNKYSFIIIMMTVFSIIIIREKNKWVKNTMIFYVSLFCSLILYSGFFNYITYILEWKWFIKIAIVYPTEIIYSIILVIMIIINFITLKFFIFEYKKAKDYKKNQRVLLSLSLSFTSALLYVNIDYYITDNKEERIKEIYYVDNIIPTVFIKKDNDGAYIVKECYIYEDEITKLINTANKGEKFKNIVIFDKKIIDIPAESKIREREVIVFRKVEYSNKKSISDFLKEKQQE